jgi:riboflavin synthase
MFTGIIEAKGKIAKSAETAGVVRLTIEKPKKWELTLGQSIAINGACLTVVGFDGAMFDVELVPETLRKTTFGSNVPQVVNLERAMLPSDRFEGHIVQGHADSVGTVIDMEAEGDTSVLTISFDIEYDHLLVRKGSVTVDGVSLTISDLTRNTFSVALIPHTLANTTLGLHTVGDMVNLEFDIVGKYLTKRKT